MKTTKKLGAGKWCFRELTVYVTRQVKQSFLSFFYRFEHVPLVTPNGDILVNDLSFEVRTVPLR